MSDEQTVNAVEAATFTGNGGQIRLRDIDLRIDAQGRLVILPAGPTSLDIVIPGRFARDDIEVRLDDGGVFFRVKKPR